LGKENFCQIFLRKTFFISKNFSVNNKVRIGRECEKEVGLKGFKCKMKITSDSSMVFSFFHSFNLFALEPQQTHSFSKICYFFNKNVNPTDHEKIAKTGKDTK
jgi:hypothetical protein